MDIVKEIKKKKELQGLSDEYVQSVLDRIVAKNRLSYSRPKEEKEIVKLVRAELRLKTGRFTIVDASSAIDDLLEEHASTRERLMFYPTLLKEIKLIDHSSIIDLGSGLNPLIFGKLAKRYDAYDIDESALKVVAEYFKSNHIAGHVHTKDITLVDRFPEADLVFLLKVLDVIEKNGHKKAEQLLLKLKAKTVIISFSTRTLSNAPMNHPQRGWIEQLLSRLGYSFKILKSNNEIFYFASK